MSAILSQVIVMHAILLLTSFTLMSAFITFTIVYAHSHKRKQINRRLRMQHLDALPKEHGIRKSTLLGLFFSMLFASSLIVVLLMAWLGIRRTVDPMPMTLTNLVDIIQNTPAEDTLPHNLDGSIIIFYKPGCQDCEAIYPAIKQVAEKNEDMYFISTRSEQGEHLRSQIPIEDVPTGVYFKHEVAEIPYVQAGLYTKDPDTNRGQLDRTNLNRLLQLQTEGR